MSLERFLAFQCDVISDPTLHDLILGRSSPSPYVPSNSRPFYLFNNPSIGTSEHFILLGTTEVELLGHLRHVGLGTTGVIEIL